ncbi:hypothetical protein GCM10009738_15700 [Kitasatospora viridis]
MDRNESTRQRSQEGSSAGVYSAVLWFTMVILDVCDGVRTAAATTSRDHAPILRAPPDPGQSIYPARPARTPTTGLHPQLAGGRALSPLGGCARPLPADTVSGEAVDPGAGRNP